MFKQIQCELHPQFKLTGVCIYKECQKSICHRCIDFHQQHNIEFFEVFPEYIINQKIFKEIQISIQELRSCFEKYIKIQEDWVKLVITSNANVKNFLNQTNSYQDDTFVSNLILLRNISKNQPLKQIEQNNISLCSYIQGHQSNIIKLQFEQNENGTFVKTNWSQLYDPDLQATGKDFCNINQKMRKYDKLPPIKKENKQ